MLFRHLTTCIFGALHLITNSPSLSRNVRVFVRHDVVDFEVWKKGYDDFAAEQKKGDVFFQKVFQSISNPNNVTVIHDFHSLERAEAFFNSDALKSTMKRIGSLGEPEIWFVYLDEVDKC